MADAARAGRPPELLVMAAGMGSRFGGPKQVVPVGPAGEIVMDYSVWDAARAGVERVVFVIRRDLEAAFHAEHGSRYARRLEVAYAFQELDGRTKPWGTAHAVLSARDRIGGPFIVINADDFYGAEGFGRLVDFLRREPVDYALVAYQLGRTLSEHGSVARGVCEVSSEGFLRSIAEHTEIEKVDEGVRAVEPDGAERRFTGREPVSMNFWGFRPDLFSYIGERFARFLMEQGSDPKAELYLPTVVDELIQTGRARVRVLRTAERWFGMTHPPDREAVAACVRELVARGAYPEGVWRR